MDANVSFTGNLGTDVEMKIGEGWRGARFRVAHTTISQLWITSRRHRSATVDNDGQDAFATIFTTSSWGYCGGRGFPVVSGRCAGWCSSCRTLCQV
jgi:hypothetical protein